MPEWMQQQHFIMWAAITILVVGPAVLFYWHQNHKATLDHDLKREMLERGMSADDICRVLRAGAHSDDQDEEKKEEGASEYKYRRRG